MHISTGYAAAAAECSRPWSSRPNATRACDACVQKRALNGASRSARGPAAMSVVGLRKSPPSMHWHPVAHVGRVAAARRRIAEWSQSGQCARAAQRKY
eukprot:1522033-Prymnesium_polylepis.1